MGLCYSSPNRLKQQKNIPSQDMELKKFKVMKRDIWGEAGPSLVLDSGKIGLL